MGLRLPQVLVTQEEVGALTLGVFRPRFCSRNRPSMAAPRRSFDSSLPTSRRTCSGETPGGRCCRKPRPFCSSSPVRLARRAQYGLAAKRPATRSPSKRWGLGPDAYGRLLLKLGAQPRSRFADFVTRMSSHFRSLQRRITMLNRLANRRRLNARGALSSALPPRR